VVGGGGFAASSEAIAAASQLHSETWTELLTMTKLDPGYEETRHHYFSVPDSLVRAPSGRPWTHLRINIFPDGGLTRSTPASLTDLSCK
jgi:allantoicase